MHQKKEAIFTLEMAGRSDRIGIVKKKIDRMIAIPLDQSYFLKYLYAFRHILNLIIYNKFITID